MTKAELIQIVNHKHQAGLINRNTSFSNINKSKNVWWLNVRTDKFNEDVHLLLSDTDKSIWLQLPKGFVNNIQSTFRIREDKEAVDLEISADKHFRYLHDVKSGGTGYDFVPFVKETILYRGL